MQSFTTTHNLKHPGPCLPFIIEINGGNNSLPAPVLQSLFLEETHTYTKELWPQQLNWHWKNGWTVQKYLLIVYTDHKNLEYLKTTEHQDKSDGPCSSPGLIPWSLITQVPKMLKQLHCTYQVLDLHLQTTYSMNLVLSLLTVGKLTDRWARPFKLKYIHA